MALPLIPILLIGGVGALGLGGYQFGRKVGEGVGKSMPYLLAGTAIYMTYQATKK